MRPATEKGQLRSLGLCCGASKTNTAESSSARQITLSPSAPQPITRNQIYLSAFKVVMSGIPTSRIMTLVEIGAPANANAKIDQVCSNSFLELMAKVTATADENFGRPDENCFSGARAKAPLPLAPHQSRSRNPLV
jgi:hypothetical protein